MNTSDAFDAKQELAAFYERHFDDLVESCLEASSSQFQWSPLNTLDIEERRMWVKEGFRQIIRKMLGQETDEDMRADGRAYYPRVTDLSDTSDLFGVADVIDSCECALLPDEGILPLLWQDYAKQPDQLLGLVKEFRNAQNYMTKSHMRQQMKDFQHYVEFSKKLAVNEQRIALEGNIYERFYLALRALRDKTGEIYELLGGDADTDRLRTEITQLKMMEADLLAEVFRINPDLDSGHREPSKQLDQGQFKQAADAAGLTDREREIASFVARGYSNKDISERLNLAESTVKNYLSSILTKLGKDNRSQIVVFAAENGYFVEQHNA